jgi:hypothetical protein
VVLLRAERAERAERRPVASGTAKAGEAEPDSRQRAAA